jgi:gliding motility-associated-like protein
MHVGMKRFKQHLILLLGISLQFSFIVCTQAQNLVPNPSFEEYKKLTCTAVYDYWISSHGKDTRPVFDSILYDWSDPTKSTPEIYNTLVNKSCDTNPWKFGYGPDPKDGYFMAEIELLYGYRQPPNHGGRSYIETPLTEPLKSGHRYLGGGYHALKYGGIYATNNLGMLFTSRPVEIDTNLLLSYQPQINQAEVNKDYSVWKKFYGCFTAAGDEQYLTLGNFYDDDHTRVIQLVSSNSSSFSNYFIDSVFTEEIKEPLIPNVITPNGDTANEKFVIKDIHFGWWSLNIFNRWGEKVYSSSDYRNNWNGDNLSAGVYFYELQHRCATIRYKGSLTIVR